MTADLRYAPGARGLEPPPGKRQRRLPHYAERWAYWTDEAERLEREYEREKEHFLDKWRITHPKADSTSAEVAWEDSRIARGLVAAGEWAHRKAQTFGIGVLVARGIRDDLRSRPAAGSLHAD